MAAVAQRRREHGATSVPISPPRRPLEEREQFGDRPSPDEGPPLQAGVGVLGRSGLDQRGEGLPVPYGERLDHAAPDLVEVSSEVDAPAMRARPGEPTEEAPALVERPALLDLAQAHHEVD